MDDFLNESRRLFLDAAFRTVPRRGPARRRFPDLIEKLAAAFKLEAPYISPAEHLRGVARQWLDAEREMERAAGPSAAALQQDLLEAWVSGSEVYKLPGAGDRRLEAASALLADVAEHLERWRLDGYRTESGHLASLPWVRRYFAGRLCQPAVPLPFPSGEGRWSFEMEAWTEGYDERRYAKEQVERLNRRMEAEIDRRKAEGRAFRRAAYASDELAFDRLARLVVGRCSMAEIAADDGVTKPAVSRLVRRRAAELGLPLPPPDRGGRPRSVHSGAKVLTSFPGRGGRSSPVFIAL